MLFVIDCNYFIVIVYIRLVYGQKVTSYYHVKHNPFVILMVELGGKSGKAFLVCKVADVAAAESALSAKGAVLVEQDELAEL